MAMPMSGVHVVLAAVASHLPGPERRSGENLQVDTNVSRDLSVHRTFHTGSVSLVAQQMPLDLFIQHPFKSRANELKNETIIDLPMEFTFGQILRDLLYRRLGCMYPSHWMNFSSFSMLQGLLRIGTCQYRDHRRDNTKDLCQSCGINVHFYQL